MGPPGANGLGSRAPNGASQTESTAPQAASVPAVTLPKGGGAIRGLGEKFAANPVTGTGSMSVPIFTSPGRAGFGPQLSLSYDSASGNGPFGLGWSLSLPAITRKADKGLPQYRDAEDSDVFLLSGAEDLVPVLVQTAEGEWEPEDPPARVVDGRSYRVRAYRPRIEGLFARIECWSNTEDREDVFWRSISKEDVTTWYGRTAESRVVDPDDGGHIFSWLICQSHDCTGNVIAYGYKGEDSEGIAADLGGATVASAHERHRTVRSRSAQRYLKRIRYGNRSPYLPVLRDDSPWPEPREADAADGSESWMFEVVLDYGDHDLEQPLPAETRTWPARRDAFSSYRSGFEVRTYRTCQRVLMFHHFPGEPDVGRDCLVRSTDLGHSDDVDPSDVRDPIYTFLHSVTQTGYRRVGGQYVQRSLPPVEFGYSQPIVQDVVHEVDPASLDNLPVGLDGSAYRWTDLHGEGVPGILTEQGGSWFYKRNLSALGDPSPGGAARGRAQFAPIEAVARMPNVSLRGGAELMDLAGDGQPDVVVLEGSAPGFYEHDDAAGWQPFRPFGSRLAVDTRDPNVKFVDLDGDGHADALITEEDALVWHASLGEEGFGPAQRVAHSLDEDTGPRVVFADGSQSIYLADVSGDGLTDLVRIRNGEVCYWPNLGHGHFGAKVAMDAAPWFDSPDLFDHKRICLADIDGSGTTDIIYLHPDGVRLYFNQSGNSWSTPHRLKVFPRVDDLVNIAPLDLLGNGTASLVWSSPSNLDAGRQMRYVDLMGGTKPHLMVRAVNNLGAETHVQYAPSTTFYLRDQRDGKPWVTRLPFPVHVVEKVTIFDHISRNRFVVRYAYHHGHFDGEEREFRGFGMVEQWDTEEFGAFAGGQLPGENVDIASHVPPAHTKTWFHTGAYLGRNRVSAYFAGLVDATDPGEYFREPGLSDDQAREQLLPDTVLPDGLTLAEEGEACRALKGMMLRQEVYADDGRPDALPGELERALSPYTVIEQNFGIRTLQPQGGNRHAVFLTHAGEAITYHYERNPADPRIQHQLTLEVDAYGNPLKRATIGYGRRLQVRSVDEHGLVVMVPNPGLAGLETWDRTRQTTALVTYSEDRFTNAIEDPDARRAPLHCEALTYELTGYTPTGTGGRFRASDFVEADPVMAGRLRNRFTDEVAYDAATTGDPCRRLIESARTVYRRDDLDGLLPLGEVESRGLPGESYRLAFTGGLLTMVFHRPVPGQGAESLLPDPASVLGGQGGDRGGYVRGDSLKAEGLFPVEDPEDHWWVPTGRTFFSENPGDDAAVELEEARGHHFLVRRHRDPFGQDTFVQFDEHDLLVSETRDVLGNRVTVDANDYRVLQPRLVSDPNRNQTEVAFDTLGMVVGTAVMGKPLPAPVEGDSLAAFDVDLSAQHLDELFLGDDPQSTAAARLGDATTRTVYDLDRFHDTWLANPDDPSQWMPAGTVTLTRETHVSAPLPPWGQRIQLAYSYSDGFGREIQRKVQAEPGPLDVDDPQAPTISPRWVGSGWTISNNKGKPVRQYEPFFSPTQRFEFGVTVGVSPVLFYDPAERVVATLHPNHTFNKVVFDPWQQTTYDVNDCCAARNRQTGDPRTDPDVGGYVAAYLSEQPPSWLPWHGQRIGGDLGADEQVAAERAAAHADTPTTVHFDVLGRPFLTVARNRVVCPGHDLDGAEDSFATRVELDVEGNQRAVRDAVMQAGDPLGRIVMRYSYDLLGNRIQQSSMEAGARWMLNDVAGKPIRAWDSRGHHFRTTYDALRRPVGRSVRGTLSDPDPTRPSSDPRTVNVDLLVDQTAYGEPGPGATAAEEGQAQQLNLRTRVYRQWDSAGLVTNARLDSAGDPTEAYDFKGNLLCSTRRLVKDYRGIPDWAVNPELDTEAFQGITRYDALNRPTQSIPPHSTRDGGVLNVIQPVFNEADLVVHLDVWLERAAEPNGLLVGDTEPPSPVGVSGIAYNAKGQRLRIGYKNGVTTQYRYDPDTLRLRRLYTRRGATFVEDCENPSPPPDTMAAPDAVPESRSCGVQNLTYTYDPVGNITHIHDDAQQTIFFRNRRIEPNNSYTYDALYRLIQATGREHLGQAGGSIPHSHDDAGRVGLLSADAAGRFAPNDGNAMGAYVERYVYDAVGNFLTMGHTGNDPAAAGWTRDFFYDEESLIDAGMTSNRLSRTQMGAAGAAEAYQHDVHGNMIAMPHVGGQGPNLHWDHRDQLRRADLGGGGTAFYVYDASGARVRKVWEKAPGLTEERIYLSGGVEIFRKHGGAINDDSATFERESLHLMDDQQRVALVETRTRDTAGADSAPRQLTRYQLGNHLGSATVELDDQAHLISYEEFTPYGSTTYQAVRSQTQAPKRYRFTGKERDEETGFSYHGARSYAAWLGRWSSPDPSGLASDLNLYAYCAENPINRRDSQGLDSEWCLFCNPLSDDVEFAPAEAIASVASDAAEGSRVITEGISRGTTAAGDWVMDRAMGAGEWFDDRGHPWLAEATRGAGVLAATTTKTVGEVGGQMLAAGPNAVLALERGGTSIGTGAARIYTADDWQDATLGALEILSGAGEGAQVGLQAIGMSRSWGSGTIKRAGTSPTVGENKIHGDLFRDKVVDARTTPWRDATNEVTIRPNSGPGMPGKPSDNFRIDSLEKSRITNDFKLVEGKGTNTAGLTKNQRTGFPNFERYGGEVRGLGGGTLAPEGTQIPPSAIEMYRPLKLFFQLVLPPTAMNATRRGQ